MHQTSKKCRLIPVNQIEKPQPTEIWNRVPKPERPSPPTLSSDTVETLTETTKFPKEINKLINPFPTIENQELKEYLEQIKNLNPQNPNVINDIQVIEGYLTECKENGYVKTRIKYF